MRSKQLVIAVSSAVASVTLAYNTTPALAQATELRAGSYFSVNPCRVLDTRVTGPAISPGIDRSVAFSGVCGVPASARAVALNITMTQATGSGALSAFPADGSPGLSQAVSFQSGETIAANAIATLAANGSGAAKIRVSMPSG